MFRALIGAAAMCAAALAWAAPEPSRHEKSGLQITFPEKWIVGSGEPPLLVMSRSMDQTSLANCVAIGEEVVATRAFSQAEINQGLAQPFGEEFWQKLYQSAGLTANVKTHASRLHPSGLQIQEAEFELFRPGTDPAGKMAIRQAVFVRPGFSLSVACSARASAYPAQKAVLAGVIESVRFAPPKVAMAQEPKKVPVASSAPDFVAAGKVGAAQAGEKLLELAK
jgi:hypothetical protein